MNTTFNLFSRSKNKIEREEIRRILIIRSCQMLQFSLIFEKLKGSFPGAAFTVLTSSSTQNEIRKNTGITQFITYDRPKFNIRRMSKEARTKLKGHDLFVIPYNNFSGNGYFLVEEIAYRSKAPYIRAFDVKGDSYIFTRSGWFFKSITQLFVNIADELIAGLLFGLWMGVAAILFVPTKLFLWVKPHRNVDRRKVLFLSHDGYYLPTARVRCYNFAKELSGLGWQTDVFSNYDNFAHIARYHYTPEEMCDTNRMWTNIRAFFRLIRESSSTILYVQKVKYHILAPLFVHILKGNKMIFDFDDWEFPTPAFKYIPCDRLLSRIAGKAELFVGASHFLVTCLERYHPRVELLLTMTDTERFRPRKVSKPNENVVFCWAGVVFGHPILENIRFMLDCYHKVYLRHPEISLRIVGGGPFMPRVEEMIKEKYQNLKIEFGGWIEPDRMQEFYDSIDVGLMPLIRPTDFIRAKSPTKLFEYMAMEKPTISSNVGEASYMVTNEVDGFLANNENDFVSDMERLIREPELRIKMGNNARKTIVKRFSLKEAGKKLDEIIGTLQKS